MGRTHMGGFDRTEVQPIIRLFSGAAFVPEEWKRNEEEEIALRFNSPTFGKVLLKLHIKDKGVSILISNDCEEPPQDMHLINFDNCVQTYHYRNDANGTVSVVFEDKDGRHLLVSEYGEVYLGKINFRELGDPTLWNSSKSEQKEGE